MKLLIAGGESALKTAVARRFSLKYEVDAPTELDLLSKDEITAEVEAFTPDAVLFFPPLTDEKKAADDPEKAYRENAYSAGLFAVSAASVGAVFMLFSSYLAVGGGEGEITEEAAASPKSFVGSTLAAAEKIAAGVSKHYILRCAEIFDEKGGPLDAFESLTGEKNVIRLSDAAKGSFISCGKAAEICDKILDSGEYGVYNVADDGAASWFDFANEVFRLRDADVSTSADDGSRLRGVSGAEDGFKLSVAKLRAVGVTPPDWHDDLKHVINGRILEEQAKKAADGK